MSAQAQSVTVTVREGAGSTRAARARREGSLPGIFYGPGAQPVKIATNAKALLAALKTDRKENTLLQLKTEKGGSSVDGKYVLLKDYQRDPVSQELIHIDFLEVALDREVRVEVAVHTTGKCAGVAAGGVLTLLMHKIALWCKPDKIPAFFEVDVTNLQVGKSLHTSDVKFPDGSRSAYHTNRTIAAVVAPEQEEKVVEAVPAEGAAAAAPGAAAPAADGKAAPAAAGAAAPAKAGDGKAAPAAAAPAKGGDAKKK